MEHKIAQSQTDPEALGGVAQRAKNFIKNNILTTAVLSFKQRENAIKIITLIDIGKYTNLPTEVDKLQKKKLQSDIALKEFDKIAAQYNVDLSDAQKGKKGKVEKPVLIISESFE